ncbi:hypothetical protein AMATHDRAFT_147027 [Amanita thiersii Skay4041]|uniref:FAD-binding PCMH-type domain-containing protein n=1 Tax=Amanita thiersii Skay4041 TaxID=703135 RepID=A0A2A9NPM9_9AGAR|nr:hypothetical protein AMATHDRAFT_147027 [Amanita thiersii Skay4041]
MRITVLVTASLCLGSTVSIVHGGFIKRKDGNRQDVAQDTCQKLQSKLGTTVVQTDGSDEWSTTIDAPWNLANDGVEPACIVFPYDYTHVSAAMKEIFNNGANYAVQAGSHTAMQGWNVVEGGVLITFSHMKNASYSLETDTITLQPGLDWESAIIATERFGVAPLGARVRDVGTGFLLGGGISFLSPQYGFGSDMFKELDVVLPNGDFVTANANNQYSDLFWALKGCANQCGIHPASASAEVVDAITEFNIREDPKASAYFYLTLFVTLSLKIDLVIMTLFNQNTNPDGTTYEFSDSYIFYHGAELPDSIFGKLLSIPSISQDLKPLSYYDVATFVGKYPKGNIQLFGGGANYRNSVELKATHANWLNFTRTMAAEIHQSYLAYTPLLTPMINAGRQRGGNPMDAPTGGYVTINFGLTLPAGVTTVSEELQNARLLLMKQSPPSPGLPLYIGEIDRTQDAYATYNQYEKLKQVHDKYDPTK